MPTEPAHDPGESPPTCGPPVHLASMDFADLRRVLTELGAIPPDFIPPSEAAEEMDDREAEELAVLDDIEREAERQPGAARTWSELDACVQAERRLDMEFLDRVSVITATFVKPTDEDNSTVWKLVNMPDTVDADLTRFLRALLKSGTTIARRCGEQS